MATDCGKGHAVNWLLRAFNRRYHKNFITLGLGDGPNDVSMLDVVDYAVIIKGFNKSPVTLTRQDSHNIYYTKAYGPKGWKEGLQHFINEK